MTDTVTSPPFVSDKLIAERPAPIKTTGFVGFLRTRLFNSPTNILITIVSALLLWFIVVPALRFVLVDAVWTGKDRNACLAENVGHAVGACWPFVAAKFSQFIYGFYPEAERWRVNLTFILAVILLLPLLIPRLPAKGPNAILFFLVFPVVAFFLLYGGGLGGLGVSWTSGVLSGFNDSIGEGGRKVVAASETTTVIGPLLWGLGRLIVLIRTISLPIAHSSGPITAALSPAATTFRPPSPILSLNPDKTPAVQLTPKPFRPPPYSRKKATTGKARKNRMAFGPLAGSRGISSGSSRTTARMKVRLTRQRSASG